MKIVGYLRTSLLEWPGKISSIIFVPGCNFRCPFCHNANLVDPEKNKKLPLISEEEILSDLKKRKKWIDGVVITGGEPTLQPDLLDFLKKVKELGSLTMIETNGSQTEVIRNLLMEKLIDYLTLDFKAPADERYSLVVGAKFDPQTWIDSGQLILKSGIQFELRTTVVPGIHDEKVLLTMAKQLKKEWQSDKVAAFQGWFLQTFQPKNCLNSKFKKIKQYSKIEMEKLLTIIKKTIPNAQIRD